MHLPRMFASALAVSMLTVIRPAATAAAPRLVLFEEVTNFA